MGLIQESFDLTNSGYLSRTSYIEDKSERKSRMTDRYTKFASELKTLNVQVGGPTENPAKFEREKSPLHIVQNPAYNHIDVKTLMNQVFI